jgi:hypothetical protein
MEFKWRFPHGKVFAIRFEQVFIAILALIILVFSLYQFASWVWAIGATIAFIVVYTLISYGINSYQQVEEHYHLTPSHFSVTRKSRGKTKKEKVHWKEVHMHKLDHFLLGGYMLSKKGKHLLFFNTKKELDEFKKHVKKHKK